MEKDFNEIVEFSDDAELFKSNKEVIDKLNEALQKEDPNEVFRLGMQHPIIKKFLGNENSDDLMHFV